MFHVEQIFPREEEKRVAKIVAIANQKGGVGKTTTAVNLSSCVAALGKKVLIVDLDPQGNTTTGYGIPKRSVEAGTYEVLIGKATAAQAIRHTEYRTDVIGSNTRLAGASLEMIDLPGREGRLRKALAEVQKDYDFIFIDCPPSLDLLTLNGLSACDSVLIPVQCEYYALEADITNRLQHLDAIDPPQEFFRFHVDRGKDPSGSRRGREGVSQPFHLRLRHGEAGKVSPNLDNNFLQIKFTSVICAPRPAFQAGRSNHTLYISTHQLFSCHIKHKTMHKKVNEKFPLLCT